MDHGELFKPKSLDTGAFHPEENIAFNCRYITIENPHTPESSEKPLRADIEVMTWNRPENFREIKQEPSSRKVQYVVMPAFVINTVEVFTVTSALMDHADTIVGIAQDIKEAEKEGRKRYITQAAFLAPGGMVEMGGYKNLAKQVAATGTQHMEQLLTDEKKDSFQEILSEILKESVAHKEQWKAKALQAYARLKTNLEKIREWDHGDPAWRAVVLGHKAFEIAEFVMRTLPSETADRLLSHFHQMWIDQAEQGWPHFTPETPAVKRSQENIGHDVTKDALSQIKDTPMFVWLGEGDRGVPPEKFLLTNQELDKPTEEKQAIMLQRMKQAFPNNQTRVIPLLGIGSGSHHLAPRTDASLFERFFLKYLYPEKQPENLGPKLKV